LGTAMDLRSETLPRRLIDRLAPEIWERQPAFSNFSRPRLAFGHQQFVMVNSVVRSAIAAAAVGVHTSSPVTPTGGAELISVRPAGALLTRGGARVGRPRIPLLIPGWMVDSGPTALR
jgi:hypothetical protein